MNTIIILLVLKYTPYLIGYLKFKRVLVLHFYYKNTNILILSLLCKIKDMEEDYGKITNREETKALLNKMGIEFDEILHEPVTNVKEMIEKVKWEKGPLIFCKNLFFKNKKTKELLLIIALHVIYILYIYIYIGFKYNYKTPEQKIKIWFK